MEERKKDHIDLAFKSAMEKEVHDMRFNYEPMLSAHPQKGGLEMDFLGKKLRAPMWVSSMTGGTWQAGLINRNLANACREFGFGMGLGSCRVILEQEAHFADFNLRKIIGDDVPFFANLGIAQVEALLDSNKTDLITNLIERLEADGLIVHVNPLQEWIQPEGDRIKHPPIETLKRLLDHINHPIIVKEVGQGMGPKSLEALMQLPLAAIEFAAYGGTNFSRVEMMRAGTEDAALYKPFAYLGHTASEMLDMVNRIVESTPGLVQTKNIIISGGIHTALDGYHLINKSKLTAVFGQASSFLKHAMGEYEALQKYVNTQIESLMMAKAFLQNRE